MKAITRANWLKSWEFLLFVVFVGVIILNVSLSPFFLGLDNLVNVLQLSVETIMIGLIMTLIIINGEIDLSVAAVMGLCATAFGLLYQNGTPLPLAALLTLGLGLLCGAFNGLWIAYMGLPSLVVTLAGLVGYRGLAYVLLEDKSVTNFPDEFSALGQHNLPGLPIPATLILFAFLFIIFFIVLHYSAFGRYVYVVGNNKTAARFAGVNVRRVKMILFTVSGFMSALAALVYAARVGTVRPNVANGLELDIITIVLLGGVSIFGGSGTLIGVGLSMLTVLSFRNGMTLANISGSVQTSVIGVLLILSVLLPNLFQEVQTRWRQRHYSEQQVQAGKERDVETKQPSDVTP